MPKGSTAPSAHAIYMREWRATHPKNAEYQRAYHERYYKNRKHRNTARQRAKAWYRKHRLQVLADARARYATKPKPGHRSDEAHHMWKGQKVGYCGLHAWVRRHRGKPTVCEHCGCIGPRHHWANIDHKYRRVLEDFIRLCQRCHYVYDVAHGLQPTLDGRAGGLASAQKRYG